MPTTPGSGNAATCVSVRIRHDKWHSVDLTRACGVVKPDWVTGGVATVVGRSGFVGAEVVARYFSSLVFAGGGIDWYGMGPFLGVVAIVASLARRSG